MYLYFEHRYHQRVLGLIALPVALLMLLYAATITAGSTDPLVPALQNNLLLSVHVAVAIVAYGTFTVAFASRHPLPRPDRQGPARPAAAASCSTRSPTRR